MQKRKAEAFRMIMQILFRNFRRPGYGSFNNQYRPSLPTIFFDSSKLDKGRALCFHSFSVIQTSEDFASLFLRDKLSDYRQNNPFKHNAPPFICYRKISDVAQVSPPCLLLDKGEYRCINSRYSSESVLLG
jgi:hypothetical protein